MDVYSTGSKTGQIAQCPFCYGIGIIYSTKILSGGSQKTQKICDNCNGSGECLNINDRCDVCQGRKVVKERAYYEIRVEPGMKNGQKIIIEGESDQGFRVEPGDIIIVIVEIEHPIFRRDRADLFMKKEINLLEALTGYQTLIPHLKNKFLLLKSKVGEITKPGTMKTVIGEGMPVYGSKERGNLHIQFEIKFPDSLAPDQITTITKILPDRQHLPDNLINFNIEIIDQSVVDNLREDFFVRNNNENNEDSNNCSRPKKL